jgi:hypothetical protein
MGDATVGRPKAALPADPGRSHADEWTNQRDRVSHAVIFRCCGPGVKIPCPQARGWGGGVSRRHADAAVASISACIASIIAVNSA